MRMKDGKCRYQKTYTIDDTTYIKCSGESFLYYDMTAENVPKYIDLLTEFYPNKKV